MANKNDAYKVEIISTSREFTAREKIRVKDTSDAVSLDEATQEGPVLIDYDAHAVLQVHNEKSDSKDYHKLVVLDKNGQKYVTGSESFMRSLSDITDEMMGADDGDEWQIKAYRKDSKNYKGKQFLTCSIV